MNNAAPEIANHRCPECSAKLSESSAGKPCPACLMKLGLSPVESVSIQQFRMDPTIGVDPGESIGVTVDELARKFPQYELLHLVGKGGMGTVYCARQKSLNRLVALKVIKPDANKRAEFADRFVREARAMAQLNHQNIITVHDFGQIDDMYYFVMEYVDGVNLRQMLRGNKLSPQHALEIVPAICDALQYAHDKGIVHRDIKPENILIDTNGVVKIADFGLAKLLDQDTAGPQLTQANHVMGTMHYMAPEQIERPLDVDHRADIYSLGVVIYELLTGELPLGRFAPPSEKVSIDVRLDEIVLQTLAKEPALRYQRVSEVKSELDSVSMERPAARPEILPATPVATAVDSVVVSGESPIPAMARPADTWAAGGKPVAAPYQSSERRLPGPIPGCGMIAEIFHPGTWTNVGFLLLSLPLGIFYFVFVVVGLSVGLGTVIVWVGIPILLLTFAGVRGLMNLDRQLVTHLLKTDIPVNPRTHGNEPKSIVDRAKALALSSETWSGVFYLLLKLPLGIISFTLAIVFVTVPLSLILSPLEAVLINSNDFGIPNLNIDNRVLSGVACLVGLLLAPLFARGVNLLAWLNAEWARLMLRRG